MYASIPFKKGQTIKVNYRIFAIQTIEQKYGYYSVCQDINSFRKYACKIIPKPSLDDYNIEGKQYTNIADTHVKVAYYQLNISKNLKHRNILSLVNKIQDKSNIFLFYDYCNQETLRSLLNKSVKFSPKQLVIAYLQLTQGLLYLHQNGLQHLAITPNNIMVESCGKIQYNVYKLAQLSKIRLIKKNKSHQEGIKYFDSNSYMPNEIYYQAPEMIKNQYIQSFKSDVWSLGIVFYEMAFGSLPWKNITEDRESGNKSSISLFYSMIDNITFPSKSRVSPSIIYLLQRMLQKQYQQRISMEQVQSDLKKLLTFF